MARPTKLTPQLRDKICAHILIGAGLKVAAEAEGITETCAFEWQQRGRRATAAEAAGEDVEPREAPFQEFAEAIASARATFELDCLRRLGTLDGTIEVVNPKTGDLEVVNRIDPKVAAAIAKSLTWLLERTRRERYGSQITVKVEEAKNSLLDVVRRTCERLGAIEVLVAIADELERTGAPAEGNPASERSVH